MAAVTRHHPLLWWLFDDPKLSCKARKTIADPGAEALVSSAAAWEIAIKHRLGKLPEAGDVAARLPPYLRAGRFTELPISIEHALQAGRLPGPHRDPFDRMLIAQVAAENAAIVTNDPVFRDYGAQVLW